MSKLLYTYTSGGDANKSLAKSNANSYSLIFDEDRKSIFAQGKEFGVTGINIHSNYGQKKTYPAFKAAANDTNNAWVFFLNVMRTHTNYTDPWYVHYFIRVTSTDNTDFNGFYDCKIGTAGTTVFYYNYNNFYSTGARPFYHHVLLHHDSAAKFTAYKDSKPCKLGARIQSANDVTTVNRIFEVTILDYYNCTVDFTSELELYKNVYSSTYYGYSQPDGTTQGLAELGDINSYPNAYSFWYYPPRKAGGLGLVTSTLAVQLSDGTWSSIANKNGTATNKICLTEGFIFNEILFYGGNIKTAGEWNYTVATSAQFYPAYYAYPVYNLTNETSTANYFRKDTYTGSFYLVGTINNGLFYLDTTKWWSFEIPEEENGKYYIYIGKVYDASCNVSLEFDNPIYYYRNGKLCQYVIGDDIIRQDDLWGEIHA